MREWLLAGPDFYKYEYDFEDEANKSNTSYISDQNLLNELKENPRSSELRRRRSEIRLDKIK